MHLAALFDSSIASINSSDRFYVFTHMHEYQLHLKRHQRISHKRPLHRSSSNGRIVTGGSRAEKNPRTKKRRSSREHADSSDGGETESNSSAPHQPGGLLRGGPLQHGSASREQRAALRATEQLEALPEHTPWRDEHVLELQNYIKGFVEYAHRQVWDNALESHFRRSTAKSPLRWRCTHLILRSPLKV